MAGNRAPARWSATNPDARSARATAARAIMPPLRRAAGNWSAPWATRWLGLPAGRYRRARRALRLRLFRHERRSGRQAGHFTRDPSSRLVVVTDDAVIALAGPRRANPASSPSPAPDPSLSGATRRDARRAWGLGLHLRRRRRRIRHRAPGPTRRPARRGRLGTAYRAASRAHRRHRRRRCQRRPASFLYA